MKIAVVGGGTAGFVSALILKTTFPAWEVDMIRSEKIGTIGVGEGSTEHWTAFMDYVGIQAGDLIKNTDATFKTGIMFEDWGEKPYLQNVHDPFVAEHLGTPFVFAKAIGENLDPRQLTGDYLWDNLTPFSKFIEERPNDTGVSQYHFNTHKLNEYLTEFAFQKGIKIFDDEIEEVLFDEYPHCHAIKGQNKNYEYDFYVDCTGFGRKIIGATDAKWQSYSKYLKMKEAIVFPTEYTDAIDPNGNDIPIWTLAKAMNAGWMFRIPVWGRKGNGYIFDSDFITAEEAKAEVESYLGHGVDVAKHIKFEPGCLDRPWIGNICAIGISANFVEPLEASSIGTSINQSFLLAGRIANYNQATSERYNTEVAAIMENIRDFIALHYVSPRRDTPFWQAVAETPLPDTLEKNLEMWKTRMPTSDDLTSHTTKVLFNEYNFALVLHGLGLFDTEAIKNQFDQYPDDIKGYAENKFREKFEFDQIKAIPHRTMLDLLRRLV